MREEEKLEQFLNRLYGVEHGEKDSGTPNFLNHLHFLNHLEGL